MSDALLVTGFAFLILAFFTALMVIWVLYARQKRVLNSVNALSDDMKQGVVVFDSAGGILYKDDYAASCLPFLEQRHMQSAGIDECLEYVSLQARLAYPKLGDDIVKRMSFVPAGEFQDIISGPNGSFCLVRLHRLDDGTRMMSLFDCDTVYGGASLYRLMQHDKTEAITNMVGQVTHTYNNVLSIIGGNVRLLSRKLGAEHDESQVFLDKIVKATERAEGYNRDMARAFTASIQSCDVVDLAVLLDSKNTSLYYKIPRHVSLKINIALEKVYVRSSGDMIMHILDLFLQNAARVTPQGGQLELSLERVTRFQDMIKVTIKDEAKPMTLSEREHVFDPFTSIRAVSEEKELGLSLARGLVRQLGGYIDVSALGTKGNQFDIYLPEHHEGPSKQVEGKIIDLESFKLHGYQVLVVEDEVGLLEIVSSMLEDLGVSVLQANHPNDALLLQDEYDGAIDMVLTDIMMPEMNGVHMASLMQANDERLKVAYMSGFAGRGKASQIEIPQGAPFLPKPFSYEALAYCVYESVVERSAIETVAQGGGYGERAYVG